MRGRRRGTADPGTGPAAAPAAEVGAVHEVEAVDDLPGFYDSPPGSPAALTAAASPADPPQDPATGVPQDPAPGPSSAAGPRRRRWIIAAGATVVLVGAATTVALVAGPGSDPDTGARTDTTEDRPSAPSGSATSATSASSAASLTAAAAGDLADVELSPGDDGFTAALTYTGVVLEPRAVGVTVAYPELTVSADGAQAVVHLDLAVWNCLADTPPADPAAADCRRSLPEYADLGTPDLQVSRTTDGIELTGTFATYTRPNGSPAAYTGRSYPLDVTITGTTDGATGTLRLGGGEATVVPPGQLDD